MTPTRLICEEGRFMKVRELVQKLTEMNQDYRICITKSEGEGWHQDFEIYGLPWEMHLSRQVRIQIIDEQVIQKMTNRQNEGKLK